MVFIAVRKANWHLDHWLLVEWEHWEYKPKLLTKNKQVSEVSVCILPGDRRGGKRPDAAPCRLPPPAGRDPGGLLRIPQETAGSIQLSGHQGLRRHALLSRTAPDRRQVHAAQFSRGEDINAILYIYIYHQPDEMLGPCRCTSKKEIWWCSVL